LGMVRSDAVFGDRTVNRGNPRVQLLMVLFRVASRVRQPADRAPRWYAFPIGVLYRFMSEWMFGFELPWKTEVGSPLTVYHGYGLVVNDGTVIGDHVTLRHGVTIGNVTPGGPCPVLEDKVEVGAGATILGGITIGAGARIGAGAVVMKDVPPGAVAVGVPARVIGANPSDHRDAGAGRLRAAAAPQD